MLFENAYAFPGLTLVADAGPAEQLDIMTRRLKEHFPKREVLEEDLAKQELLAEKQQKYADDDEVIDVPVAKLKFPSDLVIQTEPFLNRWCPNRPANTSAQPRIAPSTREFQTIKALPVDEELQMLALSGAASFDPSLDKDRTNPVYTQWVHEAMMQKQLACVTAGKEFTWGANVPASTIVVTNSYASETSVAGILQYVGRAARRGLTTHGQAVFENDEDLHRIFKSGGNQMSTEADTMERYGKWTLKKEWPAATA